MGLGEKTKMIDVTIVVGAVQAIVAVGKERVAKTLLAKHTNNAMNRIRGTWVFDCEKALMPITAQLNPWQNSNAVNKVDH